jgi:hypothetical protein
MKAAKQIPITLLWAAILYGINLFHTKQVHASNKPETGKKTRVASLKAGR